MFEYLQEAVAENEHSYAEGLIDTMAQCAIAYESCDEIGDAYVITESLTSSIKTFINYVKKTFNDIINKIKSLVKKGEDAKLQRDISKNPQLGKQKVKVPDQEKLNKLYTQCKGKIDKGEDPNTVISFYKKHAKAIIAGAGAITLSLGALLVYKKKSNDKACKKMDDDCAKAISMLQAGAVYALPDKRVTKSTLTPAQSARLARTAERNEQKMCRVNGVIQLGTEFKNDTIMVANITDKVQNDAQKAAYELINGAAMNNAIMKNNANSRGASSGKADAILKGLAPAPQSLDSLNRGRYQSAAPNLSAAELQQARYSMGYESTSYEDYLEDAYDQFVNSYDNVDLYDETYDDFDYLNEI